MTVHVAFVSSFCDVIRHREDLWRVCYVNVGVTSTSCCHLYIYNEVWRLWSILGTHYHLYRHLCQLRRLLVVMAVIWCSYLTDTIDSVSISPVCTLPQGVFTVWKNIRARFLILALVWWLIIHCGRVSIDSMTGCHGSAHTVQTSHCRMHDRPNDTALVNAVACACNVTWGICQS